MISEGGYLLKQGSRLAIFMVIIDDKVPSNARLSLLLVLFSPTSQHLRLHGATPGPVWRRQQASRILWLLSPMENAPRTQWKNIP